MLKSQAVKAIVALMSLQRFISPHTICSLLRFHISDWPYSLQLSNKIHIFPYPNHFIVHMNPIRSP